MAAGGGNATIMKGDLQSNGTLMGQQCSPLRSQGMELVSSKLIKVLVTGLLLRELSTYRL